MNMEDNSSTWVCNKRKLYEEIQRIHLNQWSARQFADDPLGFLDARFGEGTGKAYAHRSSGSDERVMFRFPQHYREDNMALWTGTTSGTTSNTFTTTSAAAGMTEQYLRDHLRHEVEAQKQRLMNEMIPQEMLKRPSDPPSRSIKFKKRLVRNMPFVHGGDSLLQTLQRDFDHWAGPQMKLIGESHG